MNCYLKFIPGVLIRPVVRCTAATILLLSLSGPGVVQSTAAEAAGVMAEEGAEVLTRGPVHEAFAETVTFKPVTGALVSRAAPALVEELPPDQRPDGNNVTWIPGYWAWDDEGSEFLWVSGIWRNLPPGRQWMPGYWSETGAEFQWVSGYWADAAAEEVEYLAEPPATIEAGPNIRRPSVDHSWMPGSWIWYQTNYRWRPGYWEMAQPDWVWVPSYYVWTPRGYIYVDGYYDYAVARRGMIFAPVRFRADYYSRPGYFYRPYTVININLFTDHLFLRPRHRHYYFGDYYAEEYRRSGYYSCHSYNSGGYGYDPIYAHARWTHRHDDRWERRVEENYAFYRDNRDERPPRTLAAFQEFTARPDSKRRVDAGFVTPISKLVDNKDSAVKLKQVNDEDRQKFSQRGREIRDFGDQRRKLASDTASLPDSGNLRKGKSGKGESGQQEPVRMKIPRSPVVAQVTGESAKENIPPKRREFTMPEGKSGDKSDPGRRAGVKTEPAPDTQPGNQTGRKSKVDPGDQPKTGPKMDPRRVPKAEPGEKSNPGPKVEPKDTRRREPKIEPKVEPKVPKAEPKTEPRRGTQVAPKVEPPRVPNVEPKRVPKVEPPRTPKVPKVEPQRAPRVPKAEPQRAPKVEPPRTPRVPKVEPQRVPKVEPQRAPKVEPQRAPKAEPKSESDDKDKGKSRMR